MNSKPILENQPVTDRKAAWGMLARAFEYEHATVSRVDLLDFRAPMSLDNNTRAQILEWASNEWLTEPADESGRIRLTPKGIKAWRHDA
ncbi:MAG: hypothetical protein ABI155_12520 [Paralcaligenes sp.]